MNTALIASLELLLDQDPSSRAVREEYAIVLEQAGRAEESDLQQYMLRQNIHPALLSGVMGDYNNKVCWYAPGTFNTPANIVACFDLLTEHCFKPAEAATAWKPYQTRREAEEALGRALGILSVVEKEEDDAEQEEEEDADEQYETIQERLEVVEDDLNEAPDDVGLRERYIELLTENEDDDEVEFQHWMLQHKLLPVCRDSVYHFRRKDFEQEFPELLEDLFDGQTWDYRSEAEEALAATREEVTCYTRLLNQKPDNFGLRIDYAVELEEADCTEEAAAQEYMAKFKVCPQKLTDAGQIAEAKGPWLWLRKDASLISSHWARNLPKNQFLVDPVYLALEGHTWGSSNPSTWKPYATRQDAERALAKALASMDKPKPVATTPAVLHPDSSWTFTEHRKDIWVGEECTAPKAKVSVIRAEDNLVLFKDMPLGSYGIIQGETYGGELVHRATDDHITGFGEAGRYWTGLAAVPLKVRLLRPGEAFTITVS